MRKVDGVYWLCITSVAALSLYGLWEGYQYLCRNSSDPKSTPKNNAAENPSQSPSYSQAEQQPDGNPNKILSDEEEDEQDEEFLDAEDGGNEYDEFFPQLPSSNVSSNQKLVVKTEEASIFETTPPVTSPQQRLENAFSLAFPNTSISLIENGPPINFGTFLITKLFSNPQNCTFDESSGEFVLSFQEEKVIAIREFPTNLTLAENIQSYLKRVKGYKLHVAQEVKGKIGPDKTIELKGALWVPIIWGTYASIYSFQQDLTKASKFRLGGSLGIGGVVPFPAQDFVNILLLNGLS